MSKGIPVDAVFVVDASEAARESFSLMKTSLRTFARHMLKDRPAGVPKLDRVRLSVVGCRSLSPTDDCGCTFNPFVCTEREFNAQLDALALAGYYTERSLATVIRQLGALPSSPQYRDLDAWQWRHRAAAVRVVFLCGLQGSRCTTDCVRDAYVGIMQRKGIGTVMNLGGLSEDDCDSQIVRHALNVLAGPTTSAKFVKTLMERGVVDDLIAYCDGEMERLADAYFPEDGDCDPIRCRCRSCGLEQTVEDLMDPCAACGFIGMEPI